MKKYKVYEAIGMLVGLVIVVGIVAGCIALGAWLFNVIMASDMPDWLKYMLLR